MPDILRVVRPRWPENPVVVLDLNAGGYALVRDSLTVEAGGLETVSAASPGHWGGTVTADTAPANGSVSAEVLVSGLSTADATLAAWETIASLSVLDELGLLLEWRPDGASWSTYFDLRSPPTIVPGYRWVEFAGARVLRMGVAWSVAPLAQGRPLDYLERFAEPALSSDWTVSNGSATFTTGAGEEFRPTSTAFKRMRLTGPGYTYGDVAMSLRVKLGATVGSVGLGRVMADGTDSGFYAFVTATALQVLRVDAGVTTVLATTAFAPANLEFYLWLRINRRKVMASIRTLDAPPWLGSGSFVATANLSDADYQLYRRGVPGVRMTPGAASGEGYGPLSVWAFAYGLGTASGPYVTTPSVVELDGDVPGDAPALATVTFAQLSTLVGLGGWQGNVATPTAGTGGEDFQVYTLVGLEQAVSRPPAIDGGFEDDDSAWKIVGAGTTKARLGTGAKYGVTALNITTTGTAGQGFLRDAPLAVRAGDTVLAWAWLSAAAAATARIRIMSQGTTQVATTPNVTPAATPGLYAIAATPTVDTPDVGVELSNPAATSVTFAADGVGIARVIPAVLGAAITSATQTSVTIGPLPPDVPTTLPFPAVFVNTATGAAEVAMVTALGGTAANAVLTVNRGAEGSAPLASLAIASTIYLLDMTRDEFRGLGGAAPFGLVAGHTTEAFGGSLTPTILRANAEMTDGSGYSATFAGAAANLVLRYTVATSHLRPDRFRRTVDVAVYARIGIDGDMVNPRAQLTAYGYGNPGTVYTYPHEGAAAVSLPDPGDANLDYRFVYLGTVPLPCPTPAQLRVEFLGDAGSSGNFRVDYLLLVPRRSRSSSPERKPLDATYPAVGVSGAISVRRFLPDGRGEWSSASFSTPRPFVPFHGLGGAPLEIGPGERGRVLVKVSNMVPMDPTAGLTDSEYATADLLMQVGIVPRWRVVRAG